MDNKKLREMDFQMTEHCFPLQFSDFYFLLVHQCLEYSQKF